MDESNIIASLLTPASDLVTGSSSAKFEAIFARAGNDTIYGYDPGDSDTLEQNIDFLFGDIFDNSAEEFEIILNIQAANQGGNPLLILERDIPSVGADKFVLGEEFRPYYTTFDPSSLLTTNQFGVNEFAVIYDFDPSQDKIQLNGKKDDYLLIELNNLQVEALAQPFFGEAILSLQQGVPDLVAYVITTPEVDLDLKDKYFEFVGDKPEKKIDEKKIGQLGTTGIDFSLGAATDSSGNLFLTGSTSGPLAGDSQGLSDFWLAKYGNSGNQIFLKQFGTSSSEESNAIATDDQGNVYLAGVTGSNLFSGKKSSAQDAWVAKFNSNGNLVWGEQFGENLNGAFSSTAFGVDVSDSGDVYVSGLGIKDNQNRDIFDFNVEDDAWIAKFDNDGNRQWFTELDTFFFNENYDLAVDAQGNAYAVGWTQGLTQESDPSRDLLKYDAWITKLNPKGEVEWIQQLGSVDQGLEFAWGVDTDTQGNVYATGWTTGSLGADFELTNDSYDLWLAKFSPDSTLEWTKQFGTPNDDGTFLSDLEIDDQNNIFLTGYTNGRLTKGKSGKLAKNNGKGNNKTEDYDAWVAKFDPDGNIGWVQELGSKDKLDYGTALSSNGNGQLYVTGITEGFLGDGNGTGANGAAVDSWVARLNINNKGKLEKFIGDSSGFAVTSSTNLFVVEDVTDELVTDENLPEGDNRINPTAGVDLPITTVNYGEITGSLAEIFDPNNPDSVTSAVVDTLEVEPFI
ncbi:MAG: hypothetical protein GVY04_10430 [Cyanobacteria bacterium]|jgi:hypothetical protein|nr:hypothetical protein [Cyanobacteria bacterium GSL.Bin1]